MSARARIEPPRSFLFSVDLEDVRSMIPDGARYTDRVVANVSRYREWLRRHAARCTFFAVGGVARRHPELVAELVREGHEVACHGADHVPLERLGRDGFRDDLRRAVDDLDRAGAGRVRGFRAPMMSLTQGTPWAWEVLAELGFSYSSSVVPAAGGHFGWPGFPSGCVRTATGVWELPATTLCVGRRGLPVLSGVYFRVLPFPLVRASFRRALRNGGAAIGYLHPYDVDTEQEHFMHPELGGSRILNATMYWGRSRVYDRLDRLLAEGAPVRTYAEYVASLDDGSAPAARLPH